MTSPKITDKQLAEFYTWYLQRHGVTPVPLSAFTTCLCGYFHTYTKVAEIIAKRCRKLGLIAIKNKVVAFVKERK